MQEEAEIAVVEHVNGNADGPKPAETSTSAIVVEETVTAVNGTQPTAAAATAESNGTNGDATPKKAKKEKKEKKEKVQELKEPPKTLQEDPADWLKHHDGLAKHKANYDLLSKIVALVSEGDDETQSKRASLPGKPDSVTSSQFVSAFADGQLASLVVKKLSIIAAVPSVEGDEELKKKENQIALLQAFADFAKTEGGVPEEKLPALAEVQEGKKAAYPALFTTLITALGNKGQVSAEQLAADAVKYAEENCLTGKTRTFVSQLSHSISMKLSLNRKKSSGEAAHENGVAEETNGEANGVPAEEKVNGENGNGETSHAPNGSVNVEEVKIEESRAVAAN